MAKKQQVKREKKWEKKRDVSVDSPQPINQENVKPAESSNNTQNLFLRKDLRVLPVRKVCPRCDYVERETIWTLLNKFTVTLLVCLGFIFLMLLILLGPINFQHMVSDAIIDNLGDEVQQKLNTFAMQHTQELRNLTLDITTYDGGDSLQMTLDLASHMKRIRYVFSSKYQMLNEPMDTYNKGGDCKNSAALFVAMMQSVGYEATIDCSIKDSHCVARVPYTINSKDQGQYIIVDLTTDEVATYPTGVDHWTDDMLFYKVWGYNKDTNTTDTVGLNPEGYVIQTHQGLSNEINFTT